MNEYKILIRGGGDLASGVAARLHRAGFKVLVTELAQPLVVRRKVSFAEAVHAGELLVEDIRAVRVAEAGEIAAVQQAGAIPVMVDPDLSALESYVPHVLVDARMIKRPPETDLDTAPLVIGLGPGFTAGVDCHAIIETIRGHTLGRVIWEGQALPNTGIPDSVLGKTEERVLRAPADGPLVSFAEIGEVLKAGDLIAQVAGEDVRAPFDGALRGLVHAGLVVHEGMKIGDLDPRSDPRYCAIISDKALAIGGGVLEAILSRGNIELRIDNH